MVPPETYADKLEWMDVTQVRTIGARLDPHERDLFCGKCDRWTSHIFVGDGWLCYTSECGEYIPEVVVVQKTMDDYLDFYKDLYGGVK